MREWLTTAWERYGARVSDACFVAVAALAAFAETMARRHDDASVWVPIGVVAALGGVTLWWRRAHPVAVSLAGLAVVAATGIPVVAFAGLFTLAVHRRDRVLAAVGLTAVITFVARWAAEDDDHWERVIISALLVVGFFLAAGAYLGARRDLVAALRARAEQAENEQEVRAEQARIAERARIAREMHDVVAHKVSLIAMHAGALEVMVAPTPEQVVHSGELIGAAAREAMDDLREVLGVLRAGEPGASDLVPPPRRDDIVRLVEASRSAGVQTELCMEVDDLPDAIARTVHRVVGEGLTNVHKHARDAATVVTVRGDRQVGVAIEVVNRRPAGGPSLLPGSGLGLLGLAERIALQGGTLDHGPAADGGWRLSAWLPWSP